MNFETLKTLYEEYAASFISWIASPAFYSQLGLVVLAIFAAYILSFVVKRYSPIFHNKPAEGAFYIFRNGLYEIGELLFPLFNILFLSICVDISDSFVKQSGLVRAFESLAVILFIYSLLRKYVQNIFIRAIIKWLGIPIALLHVVGLLDEIIVYLESQSIEIGNIEISAYGIARVLIFGGILFWLGRVSNQTGQRIIRQQEHLDIGTREVFAKLYQVIVILVIFILLLQVMGVNITALAVFGGALGVGLGFGLQSIASNFISGMILLIDRTLAVGDYIELDDGRKGKIREMNMRSTTLETFDGKDIMVPNEKFITSNFINWTHKNFKQRYSIEFQVAYNTDMHKLFDILREVVASHPMVLSGHDLPIEERPDAEICGFGDSGVDILIEFWMEGIDDGEHRVGGDLYLMIWDALNANNIEIPFPQREVKIIEK